MLGSLSRIIDKERAIGIQKGKTEIIRQMKKNNISIELIEKITGLTRESIEKI